MICRPISCRVIAISLYLSTVNMMGTAVVVIRTPQRMVVAADSLGYKQDAQSKVRSEHLCKIYRAGSITFALAGINHIRDTDFWPVALAHDAASAASVHGAALQFEKAVLLKFADALKIMQRGDPKTYSKYVKGSSTSLSAVFVKLAKGVPTFSVVTVTV